MLNELMKIEALLPQYLKDYSIWKSVYVDYHAPFVKRLYMQLGPNRVYLHKIYPCELSESLFHPHPWPSAMKVISGTYEMGVGYGSCDTAPEVACTLILPQNSYYSMTNINAWHYVRPIDGPSFSLMLTGQPWSRSSPKSEHPLRQLNEEEKAEILNEFKRIYSKN